MDDAKAIIYLYDGSFEGLLCCVHESVYGREMPLEIVIEDSMQPSLYLQKAVVTDTEKAARVYASIAPKMGIDAQELVQAVFLSCAEEKELKILRFLLTGYRRGMQTMHLLAHPAVQPMLAAQLHLKNEVHLLLGFVRFSDTGQGLVATIQPKNFVLPYLRGHFCNRYLTENFMIFDKTHKAALVYENRTAQIVSLEHLELPPMSAEEENYRAMWKRFYDTIAIAARENPRCRINHCPKRYWSEMFELQTALPAAQRPVSLPKAQPNLLQDHEKVVY